MKEYMVSVIVPVYNNEKIYTRMYTIYRKANI